MRRTSSVVSGLAESPWPVKNGQTGRMKYLSEQLPERLLASRDSRMRPLSRWVFPQLRRPLCREQRWYRDLSPSPSAPLEQGA